MKIILKFIFAFFLSLVLWAVFKKPISESGALLINDPWGLVTLVDLYIGFFLFILFIHLMEKTVWKTILWALLILTLGNLTSIAYLIINYDKLKAATKKALI